MPGRGPQRPAVLVSLSVNLSSASLREDQRSKSTLPVTASSGKTARRNIGRFCKSLERISHSERSENRNQTGQPRMQWTNLFRPVMTQKDGDPHEVDYTRVGFETLHFL